MLTGISKAVRTWMAIGSIALYAVFVFGPTAALAFKSACCPNDLQAQSQPHNHAGEATHENGSGHDQTGSTDTHQENGSGTECCGAMCLSSLAPDFSLVLNLAALSGPASFAVMQDFTGLSPDELIRPPKSQS